MRSTSSSEWKRLMFLPKLFRRHDREQRLDEEIRFHVDMQTGKNVRLGMTADDARAAALRSFGGRDRWTEAAHRAAGVDPVRVMRGE